MHNLDSSNQPRGPGISSSWKARATKQNFRSYLKGRFSTPPKKLRATKYNHLELEGDFIAVQLGRHDAKTSMFYLFTKKEFDRFNRERSANKKTVYTPTTGGKQKFKTVPRKI